MAGRSTSARACVITLINNLANGQGSLKQIDAMLPAGISEQERARIKALSFELCRRWHSLSYVAGYYLRRKTRTLLKTVINLGLLELMDARQPDYAIINEAVNNTKALGMRWAAGMVNATLRQMARQRHTLEPTLEQAPVFARFSFPRWLFQWISSDHPASCWTILQESNRHAPLYVRVNSRCISPDNYLQTLHQAGISAWLPESGDAAVGIDPPVTVSQLPGFAKGLVSIQDIAAQQAVPALPLRGNEHVLDLCAAPGGKTVQLLQHHPAIKVTAVDNHSGRLEQLSENIDRGGELSARLQVYCADACRLSQWWPRAPVDAILLDAPCSATGVIRRQPDIKLLRTPAMIEESCRTQRTMLTEAWQVLQPGGYLLYCTCSLLKCENDNQIAWFLARTPNARLTAIENLQYWASQYGYQRLPGAGDGFFYALLQKLPDTPLQDSQ